MFVVLIFRRLLPSRVSRELNRLLHLADPFPDFLLIVKQDGSLSFASGCLANLKNIQHRSSSIKYGSQILNKYWSSN